MDIDLKIREGKLSDASDLAALISELGYETTGAEMESRLISILKDPRYKTFVAQIDGSVRRENKPVARHSRGQHAIKHVHAKRDHF